MASRQVGSLAAQTAELQAQQAAHLAWTGRSLVLASLDSMEVDTASTSASCTRSHLVTRLCSAQQKPCCCEHPFVVESGVDGAGETLCLVTRWP